ncbi:MAG: EAL domain-containing protein [Fibrobacteraceae bacterium]|nr:EAL domain-containing protein [Fibrobacteraceae bacterium]
MESLAYLARQPILDRDGKIFAYELLFRDSPASDTAIISSGVLATAQVLENVLTNIGIPQIVGDHKAFVNCSRDMLLDNLFALLNPRYFVLEILEDVLVDDAVVKSVERYYHRGFQLAIDDFVYNEDFLKRFEPLFPYISYVKMDVVDNSGESMAQAAQFFRSKNIKLLAEKVEDEATFKKCLSEGYDYFQGFFFAKPELVMGQKIDATSADILSIMLLLQKHPSLDDLCEKINGNSDLAANLLKYANSEAGSQKYTDVKDAIVWTGMKNIHEWLMLMLYARPEMGMTAQSSPLFQNASHRAKFLKVLAHTLDRSDNEFIAKAFMVGLISRMDALVRAPLESILPSSPVDDEMSDALLNRTGRLGTLLRLVDAVELDDRESIQYTIEELGLSFEQLNSCINTAYRIANNR